MTDLRACIPFAFGLLALFRIEATGSPTQGEHHLEISKAANDMSLIADLLVSARVYSCAPIDLAISERPDRARPLYTKDTIFTDIVAPGINPKRHAYFIARRDQSGSGFEIVFFGEKGKAFYTRISASQIISSTSEELFFERGSAHAGDGISGVSTTRISLKKATGGPNRLEVTITFNSESRDVFRLLRKQASQWTATLKLDPANTSEVKLTMENPIVDLRSYNEAEEKEILAQRAERKPRKRG